MLPRSERLTATQFDRAFRNPEVQIVRHPFVHLKFAPRGDGDPAVHAAFVVPKKQGKASTYRNRVRRQLRERYRLHPLRNPESLAGFDLIFLSTPETANATAEQLDEGITNVLARAGKRLNSGGKEAGRQDNREELLTKVLATAQSSENSQAETVVEAAPVPASHNKEEKTQSFAQQPLTFLALGMIRFYQRFISPGLPPSCRFHPTCSRYTYDAIDRFGLWRGGYLGALRICRCNPWHPGGFDPVPEEPTPGLGFGAGIKKLWVRWRASRGGQATT